MNILKKARVLNGNTLKILAAITMLLDHIGLIFFPEEVTWLRVVGRLAMPIFAFMIAEGCRYTKSKIKHFLLLFGLGVVCQIVYIIFDPTTIYFGILITFSISVLIIYAMQYAKRQFFDEQAPLSQKILSVLLVAILIGAAYTLCAFVEVDYGFWGIMMPVFASLFDFHRIPVPEKIKKLDVLPLRVICMAIPLILLIITHVNPPFPFPAVFALPLLFLYNGTKGKANLKYFFYIFYPAHLAILQGIVFLLVYLGAA